jgi:hypothetical protein
LDLLGDGLVNMPGNLDILCVIHSLSPEVLDFLGAERSVGLLDGVLLRNVCVNGAGDLLGDGDSAGGHAFAAVVVSIGDDGAVSASGNRTVWLGHQNTWKERL